MTICKDYANDTFLNPITLKSSINTAISRDDFILKLINNSPDRYPVKIISRRVKAALLFDCKVYFMLILLLPCIHSVALTNFSVENDTAYYSDANGLAELSRADSTIISPKSIFSSRKKKFSLKGSSWFTRSVILAMGHFDSPQTTTSSCAQ